MEPHDAGLGGRISEPDVTTDTEGQSRHRQLHVALHASPSSAELPDSEPLRQSAAGSWMPLEHPRSCTPTQLSSTHQRSKKHGPFIEHRSYSRELTGTDMEQIGGADVLSNQLLDLDGSCPWAWPLSQARSAGLWNDDFRHGQGEPGQQQSPVPIDK